MYTYIGHGLNEVQTEFFDWYPFDMVVQPTNLPYCYTLFSSDQLVLLFFGNFFWLIYEQELNIFCLGSVKEKYLAVKTNRSVMCVH